MLRNVRHEKAKRYLKPRERPAKPHRIQSA